MKVKAFKVTVEETTLEVPDKCPNCGADFRKGFNLIERAYAPTLAGCDIDTTNGEMHFRGSASVDHDSDLVTGYECAVCEMGVVST